MDISSLMKAKQAWNSFKDNHPKFSPFLKTVWSHGIPEGSVIDISVKFPDGNSMKTNLAVKESDLELLKLVGDR